MAITKGTKIHHPTRGCGIVLAIMEKNENERNEMAKAILLSESNFPEVFISPIFYNYERYPYHIRFDDGYENIYAESDFDILT